MATKKEIKQFKNMWGIGTRIGKGAEKIREDIPYKKWVNTVVIVNLLLIIGVFLIKNFLPPEIPIFYGLPEGQEQLGSLYFLILPSIISLGIVFLNILLGIFIKDNYLVKILTITGIASTFFSFVTTIKIIFLVGGF